MKHVWHVEPRWRRALDAYAEHGKLDTAVEKLSEGRRKPIKRSEFWRDFNSGVVVVQSELVRLGV